MALNIEWSEEARADVRRLDKPTARLIFDAVLRFARTGQGDLKQLQGEYAGKLRLRAGDYGCSFPQRAAPFVFTSYAIARKPTAKVECIRGIRLRAE